MVGRRVRGGREREYSRVSGREKSRRGGGGGGGRRARLTRSPRGARAPRSRARARRAAGPPGAVLARSPPPPPPLTLLPTTHPTVLSLPPPLLLFSLPLTLLYSKVRITLAWTDAAGRPGATRALVNDLDLNVSARGAAAQARPPPPRTKWTRRVPHPVLIGHAACGAAAQARGPCPSRRRRRARRAGGAARLFWSRLARPRTGRAK